MNLVVEFRLIAYMFSCTVQFYHSISNGLKDVMWKPEGSIAEVDEIRHQRSP